MEQIKFNQREYVIENLEEINKKLRKKYYGKLRVEVGTNGRLDFISYSTRILVVDTEGLVYMLGYRSLTTQKHYKAILEKVLNVPYVNEFKTLKAFVIEYATLYKVDNA